MTHSADTSALAARPGGRLLPPKVVRTPYGSQLLVDGVPFLSLGGELHNSSPSSPAYMAPIWDRLAERSVHSVIGAASWQLVEPEEGVFDYTAVDDQVAQARARGIKLVLIWFGSYKNAESSYAPSWVRRDEVRFPRATRDQERLVTGRFSLDGPILSVFSDNLVEADARAFAAFMRHLKQIDPDFTVVAVQVQNEVGLLGDSRDRSPLADKAWTEQVPEKLLRGLAARGDALQAWVRDLWARGGSLESGTWAEVFGVDSLAEEVFMSWGFSTFVGMVAQAGRAEHDIPMFTNAWLGPQPNADVPGRYPSGGPVSRMIDVWQIGAPSLDFLSPDIYIEDFAGTLAEYAVAGNGIFVPEARPDPGLAFVAVGAYRAMGFHPFGIDAVLDH
ncbi:MAG: glycoside hydrolase, partial [Microbacterium sp.]|nr:glycoside hydrolase [Microbacterium sp.]